MIGSKLFSTGLFIFLALGAFVPQSSIVGTIIMAIGVILMWLDK